MKILMTKDDGTTRKFLNVDQAAAYFHYFGKAASAKSAKTNILAAVKGKQTTGATTSGIEARLSAYGFKVSTIRG